MREIPSIASSCHKLVAPIIEFFVSRFRRKKFRIFLENGFQFNPRIFHLKSNPKY